jgi:hypothetical protein
MYQTIKIWKPFFTKLLRIHSSFYIVFLDFFWIFKNFKFWIQKSLISNLGPDQSCRILVNSAEFVNPVHCTRLDLKWGSLDQPTMGGGPCGRHYCSCWSCHRRRQGGINRRCVTWECRGSKFCCNETISDYFKAD